MARDHRDNRVHAAVVEVIHGKGATLVNVSGAIDERFAGFGTLDATKSIVFDVTKMARMASFGIRLWIRAIDALPPTTHRYLLGCPYFFVDQLNMVLNFGGARVLTVLAPYRCPACATPSTQTIDVFAQRAMLAAGGVPEKTCSACGEALEFEDTPESYFAFVPHYAATSIDPATAELLEARGLYRAPANASVRPPRIIKLVDDPVTYYRIIGTVGQTFRARPLLVGAEGEIVIDFAEVDRFERGAVTEWCRLLKSLATQVRAITLVDIDEDVVELAGKAIAGTPSVAVWSVRASYHCRACNRRSRESRPLSRTRLPQFEPLPCATCGGMMYCEPGSFAPLQRLALSCPPASEELVKRRDDMLARALDARTVSHLDDVDRPIITVAPPRKRLAIRRTALVVAVPPVASDTGSLERTPLDSMHIVHELVETHGGDLLHRDLARVAALFAEPIDAAACALEIRTLIPRAGIALASGLHAPPELATRAFEMLDEEAFGAIRIDDETAAIVDRMFRVEVGSNTRLSLVKYLDDKPTTPPGRASPVIGHYRILRHLEAGGMGVVYLAEHVSLKRRAVIKLVQEQLLSKELAERFHREARALASVPRHESIVEVLDYGYDDIGRGYLVMEYLEGETLHARIARDGKLPIDVALAFGIQLASALTAVHGVGVIHRDIKPENIFLVDNGRLAKLIDFGVAKILDSAESQLTATGNHIGTPHYTSPEQWHADAALDHRADIYSLGCVLFEIVTGKRPFEGSIPQLFLSHSETAPPRPRHSNPAIPAELETTILRMLEKRPGDRHADMAEVTAELGRIAELTQSRPPHHT